MVDRVVERVKQFFGRMSQTEAVEKSVATAKDTASSLGESAQKAATEAAEKARVTASELGEKAKGSATELTSKAKQAADSAATRVKDTAGGVSSRGSQSDDTVTDQGAATGVAGVGVVEGGIGLSPEAEATIAESNRRANEFLQDAGVELESDPETTPESVEAIVADVDTEDLTNSGTEDETVPAARDDTYRE